MKTSLSTFMYIISLLLVVLSSMLGCGEDITEPTPEPKITKQPVIPKESPWQKATNLMAQVIIERGEAYQKAKEKGDFSNSIVECDRVFKEVLEFDDGFASKLIARWEGVQLAKKMIGRIGEDEITRYREFSNAYALKFIQTHGESYFEYISAHDDIFMEYVRLRAESPKEKQEELLQLFSESLLRSKIGVNYPEGF